MLNGSGDSGRPSLGLVLEEKLLISMHLLWVFLRYSLSGSSLLFLDTGCFYHESVLSVKCFFCIY